MAIATRLGISELPRKLYSDVILETLGSETKTTLSASDSEHANVETGWSKQEVMNQLNLLIKSSHTDRQRRVIRADLEGIPVEEIARRTDSNRNAVYKLVHDARLRLKSGFEQSEMSADDFARVLA